MKDTAARIRLDWGKLLAFSQVQTNRENGDFGGTKSPAMTMFGVKVCRARPKADA